MKNAITRRQFAMGALVGITAASGLVSCSSGESAKNASSAGGSGTAGATGTTDGAGAADIVDLQILATSDTHGKMTTWDYLNDQDDPSGSMAQVATAVAQKRTDCTLVLDAGDTVQDNFANIFLGKDYVHPMVQAMNAIGYDAWTTGNHEYNFGLDRLKEVIASQQANVLLGNVTDAAGQPLAPTYTVFERGGVLIGVIGMVTPNITIWDAANLAGCTVSNPIDKTREAIKELKDNVDVLVALVHMDENEEYDVLGSGAEDLAEACPELDVIIAAHGHRGVNEELANGVVLVENKKFAKTMSEIHLTMERSGSGYKVTDQSADLVVMADYEPSSDLCSLLAPYDEEAKAYGRQTIGDVVDTSLVPADMKVTGVPTAILGYTPGANLVGQVERYYTGADVAAVKAESKLDFQTGSLRRCDVSALYPYDNTLYVCQLTGQQLRQYMEYTASLYKTYEDGDLTVAFDGSLPSYIAQTFVGVNYTVDLSQPVGNRIATLTWPDDSLVENDQIFTLAMGSYDFNTLMGENGVIYGDDAPELVAVDVRSDLGDIRCLVIDYIANECGGTLRPDATANWKIVGCDWDEKLHAQAVEQINAGLITLKAESDHGLTPRAVQASELG